MRTLQDGLWHWQAPHPQWESGAPWGPEVSSYAIDDGRRLLFFDPIAPPSELEALAADRETAIVLTCPWHERDSRGLVERLGVPVYTPMPDSAEYLMEKWGLTEEQVGDGRVGSREEPALGPGAREQPLDGAGRDVGSDVMEERHRSGRGRRRPHERAVRRLELEDGFGDLALADALAAEILEGSEFQESPSSPMAAQQRARQVRWTKSRSSPRPKRLR